MLILLPPRPVFIPKPLAPTAIFILYPVFLTLHFPLHSLKGLGPVFHFSHIFSSQWSAVEICITLAGKERERVRRSLWASAGSSNIFVAFLLKGSALSSNGCFIPCNGHHRVLPGSRLHPLLGYKALKGH